MVPKLEDLTYEEKLKEMHLVTLEERRAREDLIIVYKLVNKLKEMDRKDILLRRKGETRYLRGLKNKLQIGISLNYTKSTAFLRDVYILRMG